MLVESEREGTFFGTLEALRNVALIVRKERRLPTSTSKPRLPYPKLGAMRQPDAKLVSLATDW